MASIATHIRPRLVGVLLLTVAILPWRDHRRAERPSLPRYLDVPMTPIAVDVLVPPPLADAGEWPHGMVIRPPAIDPGILQWRHSPLDNVLSVFLAPFRALGA